MRYSNRKRWLKGIYIKYSNLDIASIKKALALEEELYILKTNKPRNISSKLYYSSKRELLSKKHRFMDLYDRYKEFSPEFRFTLDAYTKNDLINMINHINRDIKELDVKYNYYNFL